MALITATNLSYTESYTLYPMKITTLILKQALINVFNLSFDTGRAYSS